MLEPSPVSVRIDDAPQRAVEGSLVRLRLAVEGFADGLVVRLQRRERGVFRDTGQAVTAHGAEARLAVRLTVPGRVVLRLAYESRGAPAFSRAVTILVSRPTRPLIPAGTRPSAVRVGLGAVWVLTEDDAGEKIVMRLDPRTGRASGEPIPVPGAVGLAVGAGAVWVSRSLEDDRGVVRIDPAAGAIAAEIPVVSSGSIAAGPAGVWTVECVRTVGLYPACGEQRLARIDPAADAVSERFTVVRADAIASAGGIAVGGRFVWFSLFRDRDTTAHRLDPATGQVSDVGRASSLAARGDLVWGISGRDCNIVRARGTASLLERGAVAGRPRFHCSGLVFDGRSLWVRQDANAPGFESAGLRLPTRLVRLDARTARPVGRVIPLGLAPVAVDVGAGAVWAASGEEAVVRRIDPRPAARARPSARRYRAPRPRAAWHPPATVPGSTSRGAFSLDLAVGSGGRGALVWRRSEARGPGSVVTSVRRSGDRGWSPARRLAPAASNFFAGRPRVDMNPAGEAVAIWTRGGATFAESTVEAALLGARAAGWSAPATLGAPGTGGIGPDAGIAADGEAVALWSCLCTAGGGPSVLRHAIRPPGGAFGPAAPVGPESAGGFAILESRLAVGPAGHAVAVWSPAPGAGVSAASRPAGGAFEAPTALSPPAAVGGGGARVAVNDAGQAVAVWRDDGLMAALRAGDGTWGAPQRIAAPGRYSDADEGPDVAIDAAGNALVAERGFDLATFNFRVLAIALRAGADRWEEPVWLSPKGPTEGTPGPSAGDPSLAMNARGDAVVGWAQAIAGRPRVLARLRPAGRLAWRSLEGASGRQQRPEAVSVAIDAGGSAAVAWTARIAAGPAARALVRVATRPSLRLAAGSG